eukprot:TRINITY_DN484_c0_g1_i2.p1 TRINITY_DN484_c0_g1~~TRINITY_DN484_c0_g1_i2.p1  ORF type:complete len:470 (-),score=110.74 TRINITY_DN484_c0_g1_i2:205-1614(-)
MSRFNAVCLSALFAAALVVALPLTQEKESLGNTVLFKLHDRSGFAVKTFKKLGCSHDELVESVNGTAQYIGYMDDLERLQGLGFEIEEIIPSRPFYEIAPPAGYDNPSALFQKFTDLQNKYPTLGKLINLNQQYNAKLTWEGRTIYTFKISDNVSTDENEPNVLIVSNHHSRELITPQLALDTAQRLLAGYGTDSTITRLINDNQIYIIYTLNPDGLAYVWERDNLWRKNRRNNGATYGVDLNRNYPFGWDFSCAGSTNPGSETYRGPSAASEPETQLMMSFQRERRFAKVLDFHSYARDVRPNYGECGTLPSRIDSMFKAYGDQLATAANYIRTQSCCMGGDIHFAYYYQGSHAVLIETGTAFQPPASEMQRELERVWPLTLRFLSFSTPISGRVLDSRTLAPVEASFGISAFTWSYGEKWTSDPRTGRYHLWLPDGSYQITVSAAGYTTKTVTVNASSAGSVTDILL